MDESLMADYIYNLLNDSYGHIYGDHEFELTLEKYIDESEINPFELAEKKRKDEKDADKLIDDTKNEVKTEEIRTLEANFYERTLARTDVDIFFLADNTGSMGGVISSVRDNAQTILDGLRADLNGDPRFAAGSTKVNARFGVGRYLGDPSEYGETATSAYELMLEMTDSDKSIKDALDKWYAWGGGDIPEGNFYAIQQAITNGAATPRDDTLKTEKATGWRTDAAKVLVIFGDAPSWQNSVNEKELKALLRANPDVKLVFIDTGDLNGNNSNVRNYGSTDTQQVKDAAVELADASGGIYVDMRGIDLDKLKEAVVDAVFDALADNTWQGGMLARVGTNESQQWRVRTPSSVMATSKDEGKTLNFELRSPNKPTSTFTVDTTARTRVSGTGYYEGVITGATDIFGQDMSKELKDKRKGAVYHTNDNNSFMRFILRNDDGAAVEGYYGERLTDAAKLPPIVTKTISSYDMRHRVIAPYPGESTAAGAMKLFVNWTGGDVYGIETNAQLAGGTGTAIFIGKRKVVDSKGTEIGGVDRARTEISGSYLFKTRATGSNSLVIRNAARDTTTLQMYGKNGAEGLGGTFGALFDRSRGDPDLTSMTMSGFRKQASVKNTDELVKNDTWKGYAAGWVKKDGTVQSAYSSNPDEVQIALSPAGDSVTANVNMRIGGTGTSVGFANADSEVDGENLYITKDAFVAVKDIHGKPSYVAAAGDDGLDYMTWGVWSVEAAHSGMAGTTVLDGSHWIAGTMTPTHDMPTTGTASYAGQVRGTAYEGGALHALNGTSNLTANFGTGNIGGQLNINYANGGAYATSNLSSVSIVNGNQFGGSLGGTDNVGNIQGGFYGPGAAEVGGNWSINKNGGVSQATGVFTGKKK